MRTAPIISEEMRLVEEEIARNCVSGADLVNSVSSYIAGGGGKRLRPSVLLLSSGLCGLEEGDGRIACAAAVELTHIASLLHDDVVDNASMRRGRKSSNAVWGNKSPVLTGDMLLIRAMNLILSCGDMKLAGVYCAAAERMIEGEAFEVMGGKEMLEMDESSCMRIITEKTASLIECCAVMGAMLAGEANGRAEALAGYGLNLGIAFQLADDALDYCSTTEELGKDCGLDIENARMTLPLLKAISNAPSRVRADFEKELRRAVTADFTMPGFAAPIKRFVADYGGVEDTFERAKSHIAKAKKAISSFPSGNYKDSLLTLADFAAERSH
ncbi:MAG: polyprenyl synthetase family protein [Candidatus Dadabacteria bacterium]|nr:polyprenyl synthetase family protein [Candidatus Dadabacteria bacterium]